MGQILAGHELQCLWVYMGFFSPSKQDQDSTYLNYGLWIISHSFITYHPNTWHHEVWTAV